jgi:hypothetical protein
VTRVLAFVFILVGMALPDSAVNAGERPRVELLDPGAEPRTPLRVEAREGDELALSFELEQRIEQEVDGSSVPDQTIPAIREDVVIRVDDVRPDGRIAYSFEVADVAVVDSEGFSDEDVRDLEDALEPLTDLEGEFVINARGLPLRSRLDAPEDLPAAASDLLREFEQQLSSFAVPYPREPIGAGARWSASTSLNAGGIDTDLTYEYELAELTVDHLILGVRYTQTAAPQAVELPDLPENSRVRLTQYEITGTGQSTIPLAGVVPSESTVSASGDQVFRLRYQGERQTLRQSISITVTLAPTPP